MLSPDRNDAMDPDPPSLPGHGLSAERGRDGLPERLPAVSGESGALGRPQANDARTLRVVRKRGPSRRRPRLLRQTQQRRKQQPPKLNLDKLRVRLREHHRSILKLFTGAAHHAMQIGGLLLEAKASLGHGGLTVWIRDDLCPFLGVSPRTISNYMRLARNKSRILEAIQAAQTTKSSAASEGHLDTELARLDISTALRLVPRKRSVKATVPSPAATLPSTAVCDADEFLTPHTMVDDVLALFGGMIDLDPCGERSSEPNIPARTRYTSQENGLSLTNAWTGKVFVHPPYSDVGDWVKRAVHEHVSGSTEETLLCLPVATEADWNSALASFPRVYLKERLRGVMADTAEPCVRTAPCAMFLTYLGPPACIPKFAAAFQRYGMAYGALL